VAAPFAERVPMLKGRWDPDASSATAYAWFVWDKHDAKLQADRHGNAFTPRLLPIAPGAKARLTRPSEFLTFGPQTVSWYELEAAQLLEQAANDNRLAAKLQAQAAEYQASARRMRAHVTAAGGADLFGGVAA
jgi:hypothetical protein